MKAAKRGLAAGFLLIALTACLTAAAVRNEAKATDVYALVNGSLAVVEGRKGAGSGFLLKTEGATWLYTNEHVLRCGSPVTVHFIDGRPLTVTGGVEIAENRDVARIRVVGNLPALTACPAAPALDDPVYVFGNSDGGGVVTKITGRVLGVGDSSLEVDAKYVQGNSGSAILNERGEVLAIATAASLNEDPEDWVKQGTRFNAVRRFGERLGGIRWKPVDWEAYEKACRMLDVFTAYRNFIIPVCFARESPMTSYDAKGASAVRSVPVLSNALKAMFKQDKQYLRAQKELDVLLERQKTLKEGDMRYPKKENVQIRERKVDKERKKCVEARQKALKAVQPVLRSHPWPCARLKRDADSMAAGFRHWAEKYEKFGVSEQ